MCCTAIAVVFAPLAALVAVVTAAAHHTNTVLQHECNSPRTLMQSCCLLDFVPFSVWVPIRSGCEDGFEAYSPSPSSAACDPASIKCCLEAHPSPKPKAQSPKPKAATQVLAAASRGCRNSAVSEWVRDPAPRVLLRALGILVQRLPSCLPHHVCQAAHRRRFGNRLRRGTRTSASRKPRVDARNRSEAALEGFARKEPTTGRLRTMCQSLKKEHLAPWVSSDLRCWSRNLPRYPTVIELQP